MTMPAFPFDSSVIGAGLSAWLLTYLIHSTVLLVIAIMIARVFRRASNITLETVWRVAFLGGIVTATIAMTLPGARAIHEFTLSTTRATPPIQSTPVIESRFTRELDTPSATPQIHVGHDVLPVDLDPIEAQQEVLQSPIDSTIDALSSRDTAAAPLRTLQLIWLPLLGVLGVVWAVVSTAVAHDRLRRQLRGRIVIDDQKVLALLSALQANQGFTRRVRLWESNEIDVPMAFGTIRRGICVPARFLTDLSPGHQRRVLAHELGHLIRFDPLWIGVSRLIAYMCFIQPLNWLAIRRLRELAEYECDRIAVGCTGGRFGFARCLTEVATWLVADQSASDRWKTAAMVSSIARSRSNLRRRIERLVHSDSAFVSPKRPRRLFVAVAFALIGIVMAGFSPRVRAVAVDVIHVSEHQPIDSATHRVMNDVTDAAVLIAALSDIANEMDGIAAEIGLLSQRINLFDGRRGSNESADLMASLESRLTELRLQRHALLESILNHHATHQSPTEDVQ